MTNRHDLRALKETIQKEFFDHPVVRANPYTEWFSRGEASPEQAADLVVQFSVFSNHFLVIQAKRMVNAATLEGEVCARNILMNELGVGLDPRSGSVEGRTFSTANAHLNWLREVGAALGLAAMELGRWEKASPETRAFLKGLEATYGSHDGNVGAGASFAIENWAAFGIGLGPLEKMNFWKQLIEGLEGFNRVQRLALGLKPLPMGFFKFHFEIEAGHGLNVWKELEETFAQPGFDSGKFLKGGRKALDAIHLFWQGLERSRRALEPRGEAAGDGLAGVNVLQWAL